MKLKSLHLHFLSLNTRQWISISYIIVALSQNTSCKDLDARQVIVPYHHLVITKSQRTVWVNCWCYAGRFSLVLEELFFVKVEHKSFKFLWFWLSYNVLCRPDFDAFSKYPKDSIMSALDE